MEREFWSKQTIHKNSVAAKLRALDANDLADTLEACHTRYTFAVCTGCNSTNRFPNRCDNFFCPECQPRLSHDREREVKWWCQTVAQPKHVILTVQNLPDMTRQHVQEFKGWFTKLRRSKFARNWVGGFYSLEVTNEGNGWHLHLHALIDARWIDSFALSEQWQKSTNGFGRIVKVVDARRVDYLREVTKYAVKGNQLAAWTPVEILTFIRAFQGIRTFGVFGSLYGKRTEWSEWIKEHQDSTCACSCGCKEIRYYSESEFLELDLRPTIAASPRPPPASDQNQVELFPASCLPPR